MEKHVPNMIHLRFECAAAEGLPSEGTINDVYDVVFLARVAVHKHFKIGLSIRLSDVGVRLRRRTFA